MLRGLSVSVDLDVVLVGDTFLHQELHDVASVVALKLDDRAPFVVLDGGSVAAPGLFERAQDLLQVKVLRKTLNQRQTLPGRPLLEVQVCHAHVIYRGSLTHDVVQLALFLLVFSVLELGVVEAAFRDSVVVQNQHFTLVHFSVGGLALLDSLFGCLRHNQIL